MDDGADVKAPPAEYVVAAWWFFFNVQMNQVTARPATVYNVDVGDSTMVKSFYMHLSALNMDVDVIVHMMVYSNVYMYKCLCACKDVCACA